MEEVLLKQLVRQLKIINFWISFFGLLFLAVFVIAAILLFKAVTFIHSSEQKLESTQSKLQSSLDVQQDLCNNNSISALLKSRTNVCK